MSDWQLFDSRGLISQTLKPGVGDAEKVARREKDVRYEVCEREVGRE